MVELTLTKTSASTPLHNALTADAVKYSSARRIHTRYAILDHASAHVSLMTGPLVSLKRSP